MEALHAHAGASEKTRRLLVSIHDVSPRFEGQVDALRDRLGRHIPESRIALLVVPCFWGEHPIMPGGDFAARLRQWADGGAEIFLHGWFHKDDATHEGLSVRNRVRARYLTAGEGEFLSISFNDALRRMRYGRALLEDITGREIAGFVAPAWLYGPGSLAALRPSGFALAEDHFRVWNPVSGQVLARGPVITWASRSPGRIASSLAVAKILPPMLALAPTVRVGVHPGDVTVPALLESIDRTIGALAAHRATARYADLQTSEPSSC